MLSGGHEVALTVGRWEDSRWFTADATAHPDVFFDLGDGAPPAPRDDHARVIVTLDVTASANALGAWRVNTLSVSGADRPSVIYDARPDEQTRYVVPDVHVAMPVLPVAMRRGPSRPMSSAPMQLRELMTALVALDPAAPSTRAEDLITDPTLVRQPLTERLAFLLWQLGVDPELLHPDAMTGLVDGVLGVIAECFPARTVGFGPDAHPPTAGPAR